MNTAQLYSNSVTPTKPDLAKEQQEATEQSLKEFQLKQVKDSWLKMNYTQSFLQSLKDRLYKLQEETRYHVLSYAEPSKDYVLRHKCFEIALLSRIIEMAETGNHNLITSK